MGFVNSQKISSCTREVERLLSNKKLQEYNFDKIWLNFLLTIDEISGGYFSWFIGLEIIFRDIVAVY